MTHICSHLKPVVSKLKEKGILVGLELDCRVEWWHLL